MRGLDDLAAVQIGDGAGDPQDTVIAAGGETHTVESTLHQLLARLVKGTILVQRFSAQAGVAGDAGIHQAVGLALPGGIYPGLDFGGGFRGGGLGQFLKLQRGDLHKDIHAVQHGAGQAGEVLLYLVFTAAAPAGGMPVPAAAAGIHGAHQHEAAGVHHGY